MTMTVQLGSRQTAILKTLEERGPMRASDLARAQGIDYQIMVKPLHELVRKGLLIHEAPFYRLENQTIPAQLLLAPKVIMIPTPTREQTQQIRMEEREKMKQEFEKVRTTLIDVKSFVDSIIKMLTPEEFEEEKSK